jgi:hypothetical protein
MKHITTCFSNELIKICEQSYASEKWLDVIHDYLGHPMNQHVQLGSFEKGKMILIADCPLWSSEIKMRVPELRDYIRKEHQCSLKFIEVKIQPDFFKLPVAQTQD